MSWREPRGPREFVDADCENLRELADAYHPFVRFADAERLFPILAESWLNLASSAPWPPARSEPGDTGPPETGYDQNRRGAGVCKADVEVRRVEVLGGIPNEDDRPLLLEDSPGDPHAISSYHGVDGQHFIDVGGWTNDILKNFQGRTGDLDYLVRAFSELGASINPGLNWEPIELMAHLPQFWVTQPPTPTVYCEARMTSDFPAISDKVVPPDFPEMPKESPLDRYMVLTYHYLYPAREPSTGEPEVRTKEGQWEAVSVFFEAVTEGDRVLFHEPPIAVVASQGSDVPGPPTAASDFRLWGDVAHDPAAPTHPVVFVAHGTHRFFFDPMPGQPWVPGSGGPTVSGGGAPYDNNSEFPGMESLLIGGLIIAAILLAAGLWVVALVVAIITLILWLITLIADLCNDDSENPANAFPTNPEAQGDGPQGGDPTEPPAPGTGGGDGSPADGGGGPGGAPTFGNPNTGSPSGQNTVSFDVRFINRVGRKRQRMTPYPSPEPCEVPTWWDYSGRWGIRVAPGLSGDWASGDQRVDEFGRSPAYWHTLRFLEILQLSF